MPLTENTSPRNFCLMQRMPAGESKHNEASLLLAHQSRWSKDAWLQRTLIEVVTETAKGSPWRLLGACQHVLSGLIIRASSDHNFLLFLPRFLFLACRLYDTDVSEPHCSSWEFRTLKHGGDLNRKCAASLPGWSHCSSLLNVLLSSIFSSVMKENSEN